MFRKIFSIVLFAVLLIGLSDSYGAKIELMPYSDEVYPGNILNLDIIASEFLGENIGGFDVFIKYDYNVFSFVGYNINTQILGDLSAGEVIDVSLGEISHGYLNIGAVSLSESLPEQNGGLLLGSLEFIALPVENTGFFSITEALLANKWGDPISVTYNNEIQITVRPVPEPSFKMLYSLMSIMGLCGLVLFRIPKKTMSKYKLKYSWGGH